MANINGFMWRMIPIEHLKEVKEEIESKVRNGVFDSTFYHDCLAYFDFEKPTDLPNAKAIIIAAVPQPAIRLIFRWKGKKLPVTVPPTYVDSAKIYRHLRNALRMELGFDHKFIRASLPLKYLAVCSRLAMYGRNNIAYIPQYGSFHRLSAFFTDSTCTDDPWRKPRMLPACSDCRKCLRACPAEVMTEDRFLIRAERCLAYHNEKPSKFNFPQWVDPSWHNATVGCMICQMVCPCNKEVLSWSEERGEFSEAETAYLLKGDFSKNIAMIRKKLVNAGLWLELFPRNLEALLNKVDF